MQSQRRSERQVVRAVRRRQWSAARRTRDHREDDASADEVGRVAVVQVVLHKRVRAHELQRRGGEGGGGRGGRRRASGHAAVITDRQPGRGWWQPGIFQPEPHASSPSPPPTHPPPTPTRPSSPPPPTPPHPTNHHTHTNLDLQVERLAVAQHIQRGNVPRELLGGEVAERDALTAEEWHGAVCRQAVERRREKKQHGLLVWWHG